MPEEKDDRTVEDLAKEVNKKIRLAQRYEHWIHWWREPVAGIASLIIGCYDTWHFGRNDGLTSSLDEVLIISGVVLIAGSRRLFGGATSQSPETETEIETETKPGG